MPPPPPTRSHLQTVLIISSISGVTLLGTFISGVLTVALPTIGRQLGIQEGALQWPACMFALVNGTFLLLAGGLADTLGRKALFLTGTFLFAVLSIAVSFARNSLEFTILMALLGLAPAILAPAGTGILGAAFPPGRVKTIAFASLGAGQPIGFIVGLVMGGILASKWHILFWLLSGLSVVLGSQAVYSLPPDNRLSRAHVCRQLKGFDWIGACLSIIGATCLIFALSDAEIARLGWSTPYISALIPTSATFIISFLWWEEKRERDQKHTLLPLSVWKAKGLGPMIAVVFFAWAPFNSISYLSTLMYQQVQHLSPIRTAIYFLPTCATGFILNVLAGNLTGRVSTLKLICIGVISGAAACLVFSMFNPAKGYVFGLLWVMVLMVGPDLFFSAANLHIQNSVGEDQQALAGSLFNAATRFATSFGLAVCSAVSTATSRTYAAKHAATTPASGSYNATISWTATVSPSSTSDPALLEGLRAAGWACFVLNVLSIFIALAGLRGANAADKRITPEEAVPHDFDPDGVGAGSGGVREEAIELEGVVRRLMPASSATDVDHDKRSLRSTTFGRR